MGHRRRGQGLRGRTVTLKYRDEAFHTVTRAETLPALTDAGDVLFAVAWRLFQGVHDRWKVRLLGLYASGFGRDQLPLFAEPVSRADRLRGAVSERFGSEALRRASLIDRRPHPRGRG